MGRLGEEAESVKGVEALEDLEEAVGVEDGGSEADEDEGVAEGGAGEEAGGKGVGGSGSVAGFAEEVAEGVVCGEGVGLHRDRIQQVGGGGKGDLGRWTTWTNVDKGEVVSFHEHNPTFGRVCPCPGSYTLLKGVNPLNPKSASARE
jgi:hypothetical protein